MNKIGKEFTTCFDTALYKLSALIELFRRLRTLSKESKKQLSVPDIHSSEELEGVIRDILSKREEILEEIQSITKELKHVVHCLSSTLPSNGAEPRVKQKTPRKPKSTSGRKKRKLNFNEDTGEVKLTTTDDDMQTTEPASAVEQTPPTANNVNDHEDSENDSDTVFTQIQ
jgi:hypothetical protein